MLESNDAYYNAVRRDAIQLIERPVGRVLELGCGTGATLCELKKRGMAEWVGGVELVPEIAAQIDPTIDKVWVGDFERMDLDIMPRSLDVILCLDFLEHLVDPWTVIHRIHKLLSANGSIIASIPNVRNRKVIIDLLLKGEWEYKEQGILDKTHLRFFTKSTAIKLMTCSGLIVDHVAPSNEIKMKPWLTRGLLHLITGGWTKDFYAIQYIIRARAK